MQAIAGMNLRVIKQRLLVQEASKWFGFTEQGGNNNGQAVRLFQRFVDGAAHGEPWCMCFVQYCIDQVDQYVDAMFNMTLTHKSLLYRSEHCLTTYVRSPEGCRILVPEPGAIPIWQYGKSTDGHTGIVKSERVQSFYSFEGNTGPEKKINREGDGVFCKLRSTLSADGFNLKGFLRPWDDLILT